MLYDKERWDREVEIPVTPVKPKKKSVKKLEPWQEILLKAADLIEKKGWVRDDFYFNGRYCMLGAINKVVYDDPEGGTMLWPNAVHAIIAEEVLKYHLNNSVENWNDEVAKNKTDVLRVMREAARHHELVTQTE